MNRPVLVTGAGGFIGSATVARLVKAGLPVRAGLRRLPEGPSPAADIVGCDLDDPESLAIACDGAGAIVHAAGRAVAGMAAQLRTLLAAADGAGIDRIVFLSSIAVYGPTEGKIGEPDVPPDSAAPDDPYCAAKRACEAILRVWIAGRPSRRVVVLRPGIVYGPGSALWVERPLAALRAGSLGDLGARGEGTAALIHVSDVAEATRCALAALSGPGPGLLAVNLIGPDTPRWNAYLASLAAAAGLPPPQRITSPRLALLRGLSWPAKALARLKVPVPKVLRLVPAPGELRLFARDARYETHRARGELGFRAAIPLTEGLADSLRPRT